MGGDYRRRGGGGGDRGGVGGVDRAVVAPGAEDLLLDDHAGGGLARGDHRGAVARCDGGGGRADVLAAGGVGAVVPDVAGAVPGGAVRWAAGDVLSDLYVKQIDQGCHIFYSVKNGYYYVYPQFIQNILLWSKHPQAFGQEGRLGNHISIGSKNGFDIDIHETLYSSKFSNKGHVLIANKKHCDYTIDSDNKTLISNNCHLDQLAQILWDDICC